MDAYQQRSTMIETCNNKQNNRTGNEGQPGDQKYQ